jgi:2-polyprenyl-3-methyl-5-hydroxy-6-metoxy-1,4-benzoquinol methylase
VTVDDAAHLRESRARAYESLRPEVAGLVPASARRVLDLGCASGALGAALRARQGAEVVGVELDPVYAEAARGRLDRVVEGDVEELAAREDLADELGRFDCVVAADVLEHLRDPWAALGAFAALLEPGGHAVVSLPNVRFWTTLWWVGARGTWPRRPQGVCDRDHLRWFTRADALALLRGAGLEPVAVHARYAWGHDPRRVDRLAPVLGRTPLRELFAYQYVIAARRRG